MSKKRNTAKIQKMEQKPEDIFSALIDVIESHRSDFKIMSKELSDKSTDDYIEYCELSLADEDNLIKPKLILSFLKNILGFQNPDFIPELRNSNNRRPDISFVNQAIHPFVFEVKGMDSNSSDLHKEYINKSSLYLEDEPGLRHVVITNMREFSVYGPLEGEASRFSKLSDLCFDLRDVYQWILEGEHDDDSLPPSVVAYKSFCNVFSSKVGEQTLDQKLEEIFRAPPEREKKLSSKELDQEKKLIKSSLFAIIESFVDDLKANQKSSFESFYETDSETKSRLQLELGEINISLDGHVPNFEPSTDLCERGREELKEYFKKGTTASDEMDLYFRRVSYFTVFKLLLIRAWEDAEFISREDWTLYNGGFHKWYMQSNKNIRRVLESAYGVAKSKYEWLFKDTNNYSWYYPSDESAINALWLLSKHNLSTLNNDILGSIYEEHLSKTAKKKIGLFYTHPKIVSLMWDLLDFKTEDNIFEIKSENRQIQKKLKRIFEPCMGSGSFICEAVSRILQASGVYDGSNTEVSSLRSVKESILGNIRGVELDSFAFFIAEINLLLMLTPLIKLIETKARRGSRHSESMATGLIPHDSLFFYRNDEPSWRLPEEKKKRVQGKRKLKKSSSEDVKPLSAKMLTYKPSNESLLSGRKRDIASELYDGMTKDEGLGFDYCASNPPYVGEKQAKKLFDSVKKANPDLVDIYQGKMDYLYWFILLGLSKLKSDGKLCYITTAYWPTAGGAEKMRQVILENAVIESVIDFGKQRLFEHAPGQHNLVFVLRKTNLRHAEYEKWGKLSPRVIEVKVGAKFNEKTHEERINSLSSLIKTVMKKSLYEDDKVKVFTSGKTHSDLLIQSWNLKCTKDDVAVIKDVTSRSSTLEKQFGAPLQGVVPGVISVTKKIKKDYLAKENIEIGHGIFVLTSSEADGFPAQSKKFIKPLIKSSYINSFNVDQREEQHLMYVHEGNDPSADRSIMRHLEKFKDVLQDKHKSWKNDCDWWSLHRPRKTEIFESKHSLVIPYRSIWNSFSHVKGPAYGLTEVYFVTGEENKVKALEAILNSEYAHFWFAIEGKHKGPQIEFLDFKDFPIPQLSDTQIEDLKDVADACRVSFSKVSKLGICPRTALHLGFSSDLVNPIDHLGKDASTLQRFKMMGLQISGSPGSSAKVKSIRIKDNSATIRLTEKGVKIDLTKNQMESADFGMICEWIEKYGCDVKWSFVLSGLPFPKSAKALAQILLDLEEKVSEYTKQVTADYNELNKMVYKVFALNKTQIQSIKDRVSSRIEGIRTSDMAEIEDDENQEAI